MDTKDLIEIFRDTLEIAKEINYHSDSEVIVYPENFTSKKKRKICHGKWLIENDTTFNMARKQKEYGKVAVLNFANPHIPGGGVKVGAKAQEEDLCRCSNLFLSIDTEKCRKEFYSYNQSTDDIFFTDRIIYSKDITVFKDDNYVLLDKIEWFNVDVITCSAPYIEKVKYINKTVLKNLFKKRISNIFQVAKDNDIDILILGAFGCGAFKNPPEIVAKAFKEVIEESMYLTCFDKIVFAIKSTTNNDVYIPCPNIMAFEYEFFGISAEANKMRFWDNSFFIPEKVILPCEKELDKSESDNFYRTQQNNPYYKKQFSILGDSISTLEGYNPKGFNLFYFGENSTKSGVSDMKDTWWGQVVDYFGGELLVNNSWSGSRVTKLPGNEVLFPSGCSFERTNGLHINTIMPDVIIVYMGTNDWGNNVATEYDAFWGEELTPYSMEFSAAYFDMISKIRNNYPRAEIWCCTLCKTFISSDSSFKFPGSHKGNDISSYNDIIRNTVKRIDNCKLIDLDNYNLSYDTFDGSHPTKAGMGTLATMVIRSAISLPQTFYSNEQPNENTSVFKRSISNREDYVMLESNTTMRLFSNTLRVTNDLTGEDISIQSDTVLVGRDNGNNIVLDNKAISRFHATFFYENECWFIRDNHSRNGIWLNGEKIVPGKKYQLTSNYSVDFAHQVTLTFYKSKTRNC